MVLPLELGFPRQKLLCTVHLVIFIHIDDVLGLVINNLLLIKILDCTNTDSPPSQYFNSYKTRFVYSYKFSYIFGSYSS